MFCAAIRRCLPSILLCLATLSTHAQTGDAGVVHEELFSRLNLMEEEARQLRVTVKEQGETIALLRGRLQEMDVLKRRVDELGRSLSGATIVASQAGTGVGAANEKQLYDRASELLGARQYTDALEAFQRLVKGFPGGEYTAQSWYWVGELHLVRKPPNYDDALAAFRRVVEMFPLDRRAPDSMYKLGTVHHRRGDTKRAAHWLRRVADEYQQSARSVADLATAYLRKHNL